MRERRSLAGGKARTELEKCCVVQVGGERQQMFETIFEQIKRLRHQSDIAYEKGEYERGVHFAEQAAHLGKSAFGTNHPEYATSLNNLAVLYQAMGRLVEAEPLFCQAREILKQQLGETHPDYATSLNNLAALYRDMGRLGEAEPLHRQAMEILKQQLGETHPNYAGSLHNLAQLYQAMGRLGEAEPLFCQAMEIHKQQLGETHPHYAALLNSLAALYKEMGRLGEAEPLFCQAMEIFKQQLGETHSDYASSLNNLAGLYQDMGRLGEAERLYRQAREIWKQQLGETHPDYAISLNNLALLYVAMNLPNAALELMQDAIAIENRVIGEILAISSDRQRLAYLQQNRYNFDAFLSLVQQHFPHDPAAKQAALDVLLRRKGLATEAGIVLRTSILSQRYRHLAPQYEEYRQLIRQQAYLRFQAPPQVRAELPQRLDELQQQQEALEQRLSRQIPEMNLEQQLEQANRQAIAANLPPGSSLVEFVQFRVYNFSAVEAKGEARWSSPRYLAFILPAGQPEAVEMLDLGEAAEIDEACRQFRRWASGGDSTTSGNSRVVALDLKAESEDIPVESYPDVGKHLYQRLIQPLTAYLSAQQVLYLSPDGELATLPFGLLSPDGTRELMGEYELRYLNVGRDILRLTVDIPVELSQPLVIANPDFNLGLNLPQAHPVDSPNSPQRRQFRLRLPKEVIVATLVTVGLLGVFGLLALFPELAGGLLLLGIMLLPFVLPRWLELSPTTPVSSSSPSSLTPGNDFTPATPFGETAKIPVNWGSLRRELGTEGGMRFAPLPGTQLEGERVAQFLGVAAYTGGQGVKSLLSQSRSPQVLHLATHGYFLEVTAQDSSSAETSLEVSQEDKLAPGVDPLTRSGLALAGANTALVSGDLPPEAEEGLLTAQGTLALDLTGTALVVLSACETALGAKSIGQGVIGLRRSFILAGAQTVVMSLWNVPDVPTAILMDRFYENLFQRGLPRTKGLEEAQGYLRGLRVGRMRHSWLTEAVIAQVGVTSHESALFLKELSAKPDDSMPFASPMYWAAFVCIGDSRAIGNRE